MTQEEQNRKAKQVKTAIYILVAGVFCVFVAPFTLLALEGAVGVLAFTGLAVATAFVTPVIARKAANWRLKAIKAEAMKNPTETLMNGYQHDQQRVASFADKLSDFEGAITVYEGKYNKFRRTYSEEECRVFADQLDKMKQLYKKRLGDYNSATTALKQERMEIDKAIAIWNMSQAALELTKSAGMTQEDFFDRVSRETALDSVQASLGKSLAALDTSFADEVTPTADHLPEDRKITTQQL